MFFFIIHLLLSNFCKYFIWFILLLLLLCQFSLKLYNTPWTEGNTSGIFSIFANSATVLHNEALSSDMLLMSSTGSSGRTQDSFSWVNFLHRVHTNLFFLTMVLLSLVTYRVGRTYIENVGAVRKHDELEVICP